MTRQIENGYSPPETPAAETLSMPELTAAETAAIFTRANIRRRQFELKKNLSGLGDTAKDPRYATVIQNVYREMVDEEKREDGSSDALLSQAVGLCQRAAVVEESDFRLAAYLYARAAKLEIAAGQNAAENLGKANQLLKTAEGFVIASPAHLLPQAILLGIEKRMSADLPLPDAKKIAAACQNNEELFRQYSFVLPEEERKNFLTFAPDENRARASIILDHTVSGYLPERFAQTESEQNQRVAVLARTAETLRRILTESEENVKENAVLAAQTLVRLSGEDSLRSLTEAGAIGLAKAKNPQQQTKRYEYTAAVLGELLNADQVKGGVLAIKLLGKKDLPPDLFRQFFAELLKNKTLTAQVERYFADEANWPFLKKLIAQYPNQFNTVIDTLAQVRDYDPAKQEAEIFRALKDLDAITPIIFERYRRADTQGKKELAQKIRELKPKFFRNQPIRNILAREDREILAEMVYLAYQPVGMSFQDVKRFIERLEDRTEDLSEFNFPADGYQFVMEQGKHYALKPGERLDQDKLKSYRELFSGKMPQTEEEVGAFAKILEKVAKAGSDFASKDLAVLLGLFGSDQPVRAFLERSANLAPANYYTYLNELKELLGVYFSDNYHQRLANFLSANPKIESRVLKILSSEDRQEVLRKKLVIKKEDWKPLATREEASETLATFIQTKALKLIGEEIRKAVNKFRESETGEGARDESGRQIKVYLSKNVGSFFAKASAGICTAQDVSLFERKDHFHINIVENEQTVQGNIQAYVIDDTAGGRSLVLRGFNPNSAFLEKIDPGAFCEAVLRVARQFQIDNHFTHVYITESLGGWHALSNRPAVTQYLQKKYIKEKKARSFNLQIASEQSVSTIYEVF